MENNKPQFFWNEEEGQATCRLTDGKKMFYGAAFCHAEDRDFQSEKVGCEIALRRAELSMLKQIKKERKVVYDILNHLYSTINHSAKHNPDSYESKAIQRELSNAYMDYVAFAEILKERKQSLNDYLQSKEKMYRKLRAQRAQNNN